MRIAVIGAGIAGVACSHELVAGGHEVTLLDRGMRLGGCMASMVLRTDDAWAGRIIDIGASYPTVRDPDFATLMTSWVERGLAREWTDTFHVADGDVMGGTRTGSMRYAAVQGLRALVEDLADSLEPGRARVEHPVEVKAIAPGEETGVLIDGVAFDAVVLAMPDPQAKRLLAPAFTASHQALRGIAWEAVIAYIASYPARTWPDLDGVFVNESADLTWIADDGRRRGDGAPVLVSHSTGTLAQAHLEHPERALPALREATHRVLGIDTEPTWSTVKRWSYARPLKGRSEPFHLDPTRRIGLCGDGWHASEDAGPRIEAAWLSGRALGREMAAVL